MYETTNEQISTYIIMWEFMIQKIKMHKEFKKISCWSNSESFTEVLLKQDFGP